MSHSDISAIFHKLKPTGVIILRIGFLHMKMVIDRRQPASITRKRRFYDNFNFFTSEVLHLIAQNDNM
ncbi:hypothetical protein CPT76_24640 [Paenibacillus sp. AR247]|nr:hypothetical protein CPT76_24640 [Paenibacillus sp. AR247]